jgi:hypothetical protein
MPATMASVISLIISPACRPTIVAPRIRSVRSATIAHVGPYVREAREHGVPVKTFAVPMHDVDRAVTDGEDLGFVKISGSVKVRPRRPRRPPLRLPRALPRRPHLHPDLVGRPHRPPPRLARQRSRSRPRWIRLGCDQNVRSECVASRPPKISKKPIVQTGESIRSLVPVFPKSDPNGNPFDRIRIPFESTLVRGTASPSRRR